MPYCTTVFQMCALKFLPAFQLMHLLNVVEMQVRHVLLGDYSVLCIVA